MKLVSHDELKQYLSYEPLTGIFTRRVDRGYAYKAGEVAGYLRSDGYVTIMVNGLPYLAHRLAWFYMTGSWPTLQVDHIDAVKNNNAWANLREATHGQNQQNSPLYANNTSGFKGVSYKRQTRKWFANIGINGKRVHIGYFDTPEEAHRAYCDKALIHHQQFARTA